MKKVAKLPLYLLLILLVMASAVAYIYYFTTLPESELNNYIRGMASKATGYEVSVQKVNRDIWNRLVLEGVEISPRDGSAPLAYISRLELEYDVLELINGKYEFSSLAIDSISARMPQDGFKNLFGKKKDGGKKSGLSLSFDNIRVGAVEFAISDTNMIVAESLRGSFALVRDSLHIALDSLSVSWPARDIVLNSLSGRVFSSNGGYYLESMAAELGQSRLLVSGRAGPSFTRALDLDYKANPVSLAEISKLTGVKIQGELDIEGHLKGDIDNFSSEALVNGRFMQKPFDNVRVAFAYSDKQMQFSYIEGDIFKARFAGSGYLDFATKPEEYAYEGTVEHLDLREIGPKLATDFTGKVRMTGQGLSDRNFSMTVDGDLDAVRVDLYYFDEVTGSVQFDQKAINFLPGFRGRYKNTYVTAEGNLDYLGDLDITGSAEFQDLTNFTKQTFLRELGGRGNADFHLTGPTADFTANATFESDSCWTYGLEPGNLKVYADLKSFVTHRVGRVTGSWIDGQVYSIPTDSGRFEAIVSGERVFFDGVSIYGPQGLAKMQGEYDGTSIPPVFRADTLYGIFAGNNFTSRKPVILLIDGNVTRFQQAIMGLDTGTITAAGDVTNDTLANTILLNLDVKAFDFQIQPIVEQFYKEKVLNGYWWGDAVLGGTFEKPVIDFDIMIDSLAIDTVVLGNLHARLQYRDGYIRTDSTHLESGYGRYYFSGYLPLDLSFDEVENRFPNRPIDLRLVASGNRLVSGEVFVPTIEYFETNFRIETNLTGTYAEPNIDGWGYFIDGELKALDLVNPLMDLRAYFRMKNETIYIDSAFAYTPGGGEWIRGLGELLPGRKDEDQSLVRASGTMKLITLGNFQYDIKIEARNFFFIADAYDVQGLADMDLAVLGDTPPTVAGDITLKRLEIRDEFDAFVAPDFDPNLVIEDSTMWNLRLNINAYNNIWIRNSDIDAEFKGDLFIERTVGITIPLGTLETIRRGKYYLLLAEPFDIQSGTMVFNNVATINPDIDFVITKRLRSPAGQGTGEPVEMEIHITGTLLEPKIDVAEGSELTKEELLTRLVAGSQIGQLGMVGRNGVGGSDFSQNLIGSALPALSTVIGPLGGQFVEEFEISRTPEDETQISVAKYISSSLYVRYSQRLSVAGRTIGVEYYLNDNVSFTISRGPIEGTENEGIEGISFDLNLNFEY
ncbi:MAG: hypothetical protein A2W25_05865 [candidate division Zixibacteria bacterium RBG_16_53_22]|nr:MAG: hypothetical protein A2W25_05865 [candidate division Zixibacteria bacterium RBG_16_53_22]